MTTVLLVDDDDDVRTIVGEGLIDAGFDLIAAPETATGLQEFEQHPEIDVCLVDLIMPMGVPDGVSFARSVKAEKPTVPVILMTGYYSAAEKARGVADSLLYKPLSVDAIVSEIKQRLR